MRLLNVMGAGLCLCVSLSVHSEEVTPLVALTRQLRRLWSP